MGDNVKAQAELEAEENREIVQSARRYLTEGPGPIPADTLGMEPDPPAPLSIPRLGLSSAGLIERDQAAGPRPEREGREGDTQPMPIGNDLPIAHIEVMKDLQDRLDLGIKRYGQPLQPHNGRNALRDAYEEALDMCVYLWTALYESEHPEAVLMSPHDVILDIPGVVKSIYQQCWDEDAHPAPRTVLDSVVAHLESKGYYVTGKIAIEVRGKEVEISLGGIQPPSTPSPLIGERTITVKL